MELDFIWAKQEPSLQSERIIPWQMVEIWVARMQAKFHSFWAFKN